MEMNKKQKAELVVIQVLLKMAQKRLNEFRVQCKNEDLDQVDA